MAVRLDAHPDQMHQDHPFHMPVRVATTGPITISTDLNSGDTIDGVTLANNDAVLVKDQSTGAENGIYVVGSIPGRRYDMLDGLATMGTFVAVRAGTVNGGKVFRNTNTTLPTIGSTALTFAEFSSGGGGSLDVSDGTTTVSPTSLLSFDPADFSVTDLGSDEALVEFIGSGGGGTDETIPTGGTLYDGTSTSGWTSFGSPDTFDADSTVADAFYLRKATMGTNNLVGAYRAVGGSFPRTYTMRLKAGFAHANFHGANMIIGEASPGKLWSWGYVYDGFRHHQRYAWTSASASGANVDYGGNNTINIPGWYRIVVNSSTDVELWASLDGYIYYRYAASQNPSFTIGVFGFAMYTFAAIEMKAAFDWIHES